VQKFTRAIQPADRYFLNRRSGLSPVNEDRAVRRVFLIDHRSSNVLIATNETLTAVNEILARQRYENMLDVSILSRLTALDEISSRILTPIST